MSHAILPTVLIKGSVLVPGTVEVHLQRGIPDFRIVGMADRVVREAQVRVRAAITASGFKLPLGHISINIGPADLPKRGTHYDLAIALGILIAAKAVKPAEFLALGELGLDGTVKPLAWPEAAASYAQHKNIPWILAYAPTQGGAGAYANNLKEAITQVQNKSWVDQAPYQRKEKIRLGAYAIDSIQGNYLAKRALCIALAGRYPLLLSGPPGTGKSTLVQAASELVPPPTLDELRTRSLHIREEEQQKIVRVPQTASAALVLGTDVRAGLLAEAQGGILFLDELPHFMRQTLDALRQPVEEAADQGVTIVAARNYCPCGRAGIPGEICMCSPGQLARYARLLSAPLLDRFAISADMDYLTGQDKPVGATYAEAIIRLRKECTVLPMHDKANQLLTRAIDRHTLSFRARDQINKVAQTIAHLEMERVITESHVQEALQYRVRAV